MALKTRVKVGNITNLSDARYCAGMGVDMLGYTVIPGGKTFIPPKLYQEIRGWISGPAAVAEVYGLADAADLDLIMEEYRPDYLEVHAGEIELIKAHPGPPLIVSVDDAGELKQLHQWKDRIAFLQVTKENLIGQVNGSFDILLAVKPGVVVDALLDTLPIQGIALTGSDELRPGYKDYDELARVLEDLEC